MRVELVIAAGLAAIIWRDYALNAKADSQYLPPKAAAPYLHIFASAAARYGVPENLLIRTAEQESHFDPNAYNASSGAEGIMQLVPRWYPGVDPYNPAEAIPAAAQSLRRYHDRFGSWALALAAYNWGPGNVGGALEQNRPVTSWPTETQNYVADITGDIGLAGVA